MVHRRGLVSGIGLGWTPVPSIGSYGLGSGDINAAAEEKTEERERKITKKWGRKVMGYVLYGVLILF
jgi:hypothetical protein